MQLVLEILLVAWLPGALALRLPGPSRDYRRALPLDERLFWAVLLSVVWSTTAAFVLASYDRYSFARLLTIDGVVSVLLFLPAVADIVARRFDRPTTPAPSATVEERRGTVSRSTTPWRIVVPAALVAIGCVLYFPPSEYIIGGKDPGTYINEGIQIAQRGQTVIDDPVIAGLPDTFRDLFMPDHGQSTYYSLRFMGFFVQDPDRGSVVGQFPHLYPASIAIGYGLNGLSGARQATGVWAILGVVAVFMMGARLFGVIPAAAAAILLAVNVVVVWFGRYPNSELTMQTLLFGALLAASHARSGGRTFFGVVAGILLGLALLARYEVVLAVAAFTGAAVLAPVSGLRLGRGFGIALILTATIAMSYLAGTMRAYTALPLGFIRNTVGWWLLVALAVGAVVANRVVRIEAVRQAIRRWLPVTMAAAIVVLSFYAYFLREPGNGTALGDAMAFRTFAWYVNPWGLLIAVAGAAAFYARSLWRDPTFAFTAFAFCSFFFYKTRIVPEHFWTARRFLGIALPVMLLFMTSAVARLVSPVVLGRLPGLSRHGRVNQVLSALLVATLLAPLGVAYWTASRPVARHVEYAGVIPELEQLAARIGDNDLLLVEGRNAGTDLHVFAMPLAYIYARKLLVLESAAPDRAQFETFVRWAADRYDRVLFLGGGGTDILTRTTHATPLGGRRFQVPEYDSPLNAYPTTVHAKEFEFGLYELTAGVPAERGPVDLVIGGNEDDLHVVRFHARERHADGSLYRWTTAQSFVVLPHVPAGARELTLVMNAGGRPDSAPAPVVEVAIDEQPLGTVIVTGVAAEYSFALPEELVATLAAGGGPVRVRLRVPTWNPAEVFGVPDTRDLGVMVSRTTLR
jgi:hypothetical protein